MDVYIMNLNEEDIVKLEEQILLIYKLVIQKKMFEKFFCEGLDYKEPLKDENILISRLCAIDNVEDLLRGSIIELEVLKKRNGEGSNIDFNKILNSFDFNELYKKYGMKNSFDIEKLDIKRLLSLI
jgi:hypothetical protein